MQISAEDLCQLLNGDLEGDASVMVNSVAKIEEAHPTALAFLANPKYEQHLYTSKAGVVLVRRDFKPEKPVKPTLIRVDDPYAAFTTILRQYVAILTMKEGIEESSFIGEGSTHGEGLYLGAFAYVGKQVKLGNNVKIYPGCYVGDHAVIGDNTVLYPNVIIYHMCRVGSDCIIHAGAVVGSDGFGFAPQPDGSYDKIPQTGNVIIEDRVEIGANATIDRATMGSTIIRKGAKIDNLVQLAHNTEVGMNTVIAAQSGVAGSTRLGKHVVVGGQVGFSGHIEIADGSKFGAQSGILGTIKEEGQSWMGSPATGFKEHFKSQAVFRNLPDLDKRVHALTKELEALKKMITEKEQQS